MVLRWRRLDPRTRQVVFILLGRFRHLYESPCSRTNSYDSRFGCGSYRFDGDGCVCMCLHTTHNAAAAPCPACFHPPTTPFFDDEVYCLRISAPTTLADGPSEFRGHRAPFIDPAPAPRGAGVSFSRVPCGTRALSTAAIPGILRKYS